MSDAQIEEMIPAKAQASLISAGMLPKRASADDLRRLLAQSRPTSATRHRSPRPTRPRSSSTGSDQAHWRILVGDDAKTLDAAVRVSPEAAYDYAGLAKAAARVRANSQNASETTVHVR